MIGINIKAIKFLKKTREKLCNLRIGKGHIGHIKHKPLKKKIITTGLHKI